MSSGPCRTCQTLQAHRLRIPQQQHSLLLRWTGNAFLAEAAALTPMPDDANPQVPTGRPVISPAAHRPELLPRGNVHNPYECVFTGQRSKSRRANFGLQGRWQAPTGDRHQQRANADNLW